MTPATAKALKIGGIILLVVVVLYIIYYFMSGSSKASDQFTSMPNKDIDGAQYDISTEPSEGLEKDAQKAIDKGAVAFMTRGGTTWFKNAKTPITPNLTPGGTLYVKK